MTKLYLDIDGVLLTKHNTRAADGIEEFLDHVLAEFDCYWLTTHCRDGNPDHLLRMLAFYFTSDVMVKIQRVKPTAWNTLKTEAIDFNTDFFWVDDYVFEAEMNVLRRHKCLNKLLLVDLDKENEIENAIIRLKKEEWIKKYHKELLEYIIPQIDYVMEHQFELFLEDAIYSVKRHESSWSYGGTDVFFDNYFYESPEYQALKEKYKNRLRNPAKQ